MSGSLFPSPHAYRLLSCSAVSANTTMDVHSQCKCGILTAPRFTMMQTLLAARSMEMRHEGLTAHLHAPMHCL